MQKNYHFVVLGAFCYESNSFFGEKLLEGVEEHAPEHAETRRLLAKLRERSDAEHNKLEPPDPKEVNGVSPYDKVPSG